MAGGCTSLLFMGAIYYSVQTPEDAARQVSMQDIATCLFGDARWAIWLVCAVLVLVFTVPGSFWGTPYFPCGVCHRPSTVDPHCRIHIMEHAAVEQPTEENAWK